MSMKIKSQITFQAKDEAEALRIAGDRLGREAVLLSTQVIKVGGFLGFFRKTVLKVTAAILEEERKPETDTEKKERLAAFQKLLDFKKVIGSSAEGVTEGEKDLLDGQKTPPAAPPLSGGGVYSPIPRKPGAEKEKAVSEETEDRAEISPRGRALAAEKPTPSSHSTGKLQEEVDEISQRLDRVLKRLEAERYDPPPPFPETRVESSYPASSQPMCAKCMPGVSYKNSERILKVRISPPGSEPGFPSRRTTPGMPSEESGSWSWAPREWERRQP